MVTSARDLVGTAEASGRLPVLDAGDWYLVGSRTLGLADRLSDWDTVVLSAADLPSPDQGVLDEVFGVRRPVPAGRPTLDLHVAWRSVAAVEIEVCGPDARTAREAGDLVPWVHTMRHAVPLRPPTGVGEAYRAGLARRFDAARPRLLRQAYERYRRARNEAVAALARPDGAVQAMLTGECAAAAARVWLLAGGEPYPGGKWMLAVLGRTFDGDEAAALLRRTLDAAGSPADRFDAHWDLWRALDRRVEAAGVVPD